MIKIVNTDGGNLGIILEDEKWSFQERCDLL